MEQLVAIMPSVTTRPAASHLVDYVRKTNLITLTPVYEAVYPTVQFWVPEKYLLLEKILLYTNKESSRQPCLVHLKPISDFRLVTIHCLM